VGGSKIYDREVKRINVLHGSKVMVEGVGKDNTQRITG
jgi:hypothetical protein